MSEGGAPGGVSFDAAAASLGLASPLFDHLHAAAAAMQEGQPAVLDLAALAAAAQPLPLALGAFQSPGALQNGMEGTPDDESTPAQRLRSGPSRVRLGSAAAKASKGAASAGGVCQVEGCGAPLEGLREYHQRYKVCEEHLKIPHIVRDGQKVRFCQQCGRFQPLEEFDGDKRSCRERLQKHNARRRKRAREGAAGGDAKPGHAGGSAAAAAAAAAAAVAAADMVQLGAGPFVGPDGFVVPGGAMLAPALPPVDPQELQMMEEALRFASATLAHAGQAGGGEGAEGAGPGLPFVPTPDVMMLLLKGYAAMFRYDLEAATIRPLAPSSQLPEADGLLGLGALDVEQLVRTQGLLAGVGGALNGEGEAGALAGAELEAAAAALAAEAAGVDGMLAAAAQQQQQHQAGQEQQPQPQPQPQPQQQQAETERPMEAQQQAKQKASSPPRRELPASAAAEQPPPEQPPASAPPPEQQPPEQPPPEQQQQQQQPQQGGQGAGGVDPDELAAAVAAASAAVGMELTVEQLLAAMLNGAAMHPGG